jgi:hypothetical protein
MKTIYRIEFSDGKSKDFSTYQAALMWLWNYCYTWSIESLRVEWTENVPSLKLITIKVTSIVE